MENFYALAVFEEGQLHLLMKDGYSVRTFDSADEAEGERDLEENPKAISIAHIQILGE